MITIYTRISYLGLFFCNQCKRLNFPPLTAWTVHCVYRTMCDTNWSAHCDSISNNWIWFHIVEKMESQSIRVFSTVAAQTHLNSVDREHTRTRKSANTPPIQIWHVIDGSKTFKPYENWNWHILLLLQYNSQIIIWQSERMCLRAKWTTSKESEGGRSRKNFKLKKYTRRLDGRWNEFPEHNI